MNNTPLLVGVTGGIGSGKSIVCKIFNTLGVPSYDADSRAKMLMQENSMLKTAIVDAFGEDVYDPSGGLNRKLLASKVFGDTEKLEQLNGLVHPAVAKDFEEWVSQNREKTILVKEAALLVESGSYKQLDVLVCVTAPLQTRIQRVAHRDAFRTHAQIQEIISKQMPQEEKINYADFVINNSETELIVPQVLKIFEAIKKASL